MCCPLHRTSVLPKVLANGECNPTVGKIDEHGRITRCEIPCFIEDAVVRQVVLDVLADDVATPDHGGGIEWHPFAVALRPVQRTDDGDEVANVVESRRQIEQCGSGRILETAPQGQILDRVPGQHQFGKQEDLRLRLLGAPGSVPHDVGIPRQIAHGGIALSQEHTQRHTGRLVGCSPPCNRWGAD